MKIVINILQTLGTAAVVAVLAISIIGMQTTLTPRSTWSPKTTLIGAGAASSGFVYLFGTNGTQNWNGNFYGIGATGQCGNSTACQAPVSQANTISTLQCYGGVNLLGSTSGSITINKNGTDSAITCTIAGACTAGTNCTCNDTTHSISVVSGDTLQMHVQIASGAPASSNLACSVLAN